jgi:carbon starvation protein
MTTILPVVAISAVVLLGAYLLYGRLVARWLGVDATRTTPAVACEDGNDFVPAPAPVVLGGHFTAIAAAGPIVGPILAGMMFGWLPALLWILLGAIFIGGVHDAGALLASVRHRATSITQVVRQNMSRTAYVTFLLFVWISLVYVIIAFADVTASTFARFQKVTMQIDGQAQLITVNGGAVAVGAAAYLIASLLLGVLLRFTRVRWYWLLTLMVAGLALCIWQAPHLARWLAGHGWSFMDTSSQVAAVLTKRWDQVLLAYCFVASIVPMWLLLQPRGVIGATFLYAALAFGVAGTLVGGWSSQGALAIRWPMFTAFEPKAGMMLFPFLFITIACGACSGFHAIVASGTTCKQLRSERDVRPVGYGAMLLEAMVAVFALTCVMVMARGAAAGNPDLIYARGIGTFMSQVGIDLRFAVGFGLLAFSSFVFDTLDVCTRLGRYVLQEILQVRGLWGGALATLVTLAAPSLYLHLAPAGAFATFWTIFGTSNQLLAALTLVGVSVWLGRTGRPVWFALLPAMFMLASTGTALVLNFKAFLAKYRLIPSMDASELLRRYNLATPQDVAREMRSLPINMGIALVLLGLGLLVVFEALRVWRQTRMVAVTADAGRTAEQVRW